MSGNTEQSYIDIDQSRRQVRLSGAWTVFNANTIGDILREQKDTLKAMQGKAAVDLRAVDALDTVGAWLIRHYMGIVNDKWQLTDKQNRLFDFLPDTAPQRHTGDKLSPHREWLERIGRHATDIAGFLYGVIAFAGVIFATIAAHGLRPSYWRLASVTRHIFETGIAALPIIGLLAFLMSMVVSYQGALQLQKFGADIFTIDLTVISMLREMAPLVTAIMVAGRSGSAFAAEIGVMRLRKETDALEAMGLDPVELLVVPRLLALLITLPLLTFFADLVGMAGGALMSWSLLDIGVGQYLDRVAEVATPTMYLVGMIKTPVFAFLIALICTYQGMSVSGSAESVGKATTVAVVQSIFMVIFADAAFSILFAELDI